ncbi:MAG: type III-B CRISPR module-associated protein Cmr5 [Methanoregula sp.]|nr:type III-B CRISPR module-associated protein Cmr5 [Methanoregula sp.]
MGSDQILTKKQIRAHKAWDCVNRKVNATDKQDYLQLARSFPALVHSCGLVEAVAFVTAKGDHTGRDYLSHLREVMMRNCDLADESRQAPLSRYQQLSRDAIDSATWLKRYAETLLKVKTGAK